MGLANENRKRECECNAGFGMAVRATKRVKIEAVGFKEEDYADTPVEAPREGDGDH